MTRLEEAQGLSKPSPTEEQKAYPQPPPSETKGADVDHAEPSDAIKDAAVPPREISDTNPPALALGADGDPENHPETEVGHVMVEGSPEKTAEIRQLEEEVMKSPEAKLVAEMQPAALDPEVAAEIAKEEMKDTVPPSPPAVRSLSPLSVGEGEGQGQEERVQTPPLDDVLDLGEDDAGPGPAKKRPRDLDLEPAPKRPRRRQFPPLPESLDHLIHPPTTCIYISNLRRPLLLPALHEFLFLDDSDAAPATNKHSTLFPPARGPFASEEYPNVWLSGVKSHAYAVFDTVDQAVDTVKRIDGKQFPEETGGELKVDFVDEDEVPRLLEQEEKAWANGRQKLDLKIVKEDEGYRFDLTRPETVGSRTAPAAAGSMRGGLGRTNGFGSRAPLPGAGRPLTGVNALPSGAGARGGPFPMNGGGGSRYPPPRGAFNGPMGGRGVPPHLDRRGDALRDGPGGAGGDSYRPGDRNGADDRWRRGGDDGRRDRMGGGGDSYRPGDGSGDGHWGRNGDDRRTAARPNLSWREGPPRR